MNIIEFSRSDDKKLAIEIIKYSPDDLSTEKTLNRHRNNFHSIFFILGGESTHEIDFENYVLNNHQIVLIPKGAIHWEKERKNLDGYVIQFQEEFFSNHQKRLLYGLMNYAIALRKILVPLPENSVATIKLYFDLLLVEQNAYTNQNHIFILQNLMLAFLNKLEGLIQNLPEINSFIQYRSIFQQFIELVEQSYDKHSTIDFYIDELNITKRKLNETIKKITGQTAVNFIIDRIMMEAKRELCFSENSIKEIAFKLGYDNQYYFSRIFKSRMGKSPESFRIEYAL